MIDHLVNELQLICSEPSAFKLAAGTSQPIRQPKVPCGLVRAASCAQRARPIPGRPRRCFAFLSGALRSLRRIPLIMESGSAQVCGLAMQPAIVFAGIRKDAVLLVRVRRSRVSTRFRQVPMLASLCTPLIDTAAACDSIRVHRSFPASDSLGKGLERP
jgi:hypothetical protein